MLTSVFRRKWAADVSFRVVEEGAALGDQVAVGLVLSGKLPSLPRPLLVSSLVHVDALLHGLAPGLLLCQSQVPAQLAIS